MPKHGQAFMQDPRVTIELACHHQVIFRVTHAPRTRAKPRGRKAGEEIYCVKCETMQEALVRVSGIGAREWRYRCTCGYGRRYAQSQLLCTTSAAKHHLVKHPNQTVTVYYADEVMHVWEPQPTLSLDGEPPF